MYLFEVQKNMSCKIVTNMVCVARCNIVLHKIKNINKEKDHTYKTVYKKVVFIYRDSTSEKTYITLYTLKVL